MWVFGTSVWMTSMFTDSHEEQRRKWDGNEFKWHCTNLYGLWATEGDPEFSLESKHTEGITYHIEAQDK